MLAGINESAMYLNHSRNLRYIVIPAIGSALISLLPGPTFSRAITVGIATAVLNGTVLFVDSKVKKLGRDQRSTGVSKSSPTHPKTIDPSLPESPEKPKKIIQTKPKKVIPERPKKVISENPRKPDSPIPEQRTAINDQRAAASAAEWLSQSGITIKSSRQKLESDDVYDNLARFLGQNFDALQGFYKQIKWSLRNGRSINLSLASNTPAEISQNTQFLYMLRDYAFVLQKSRYYKDTKKIFAVPHNEGKVIDFFTGTWFERFVYLEVSALLAQANVEYDALVNCQLSLPGGHDAELDLFFLINQSLPLWIECKTGGYQNHLFRYSKMRSQLGILKKRAFLMILDLDETLADQLTSLHEITVVNQNNFRDKIEATLDLNP